MTDIRTGFGYDIHRFRKGHHILLAGLKIECDVGVSAHSDGDILFHSLAQALLASVGLDDIGTYYPDNSSLTKDMNSGRIVEFALEEVKKREYKISSLSVAVVLEKPKLACYRKKLKKRISDILCLEEDRIALHFNTSEKVGPVGEGKAIECYSVVTIAKE